MPNISAASPAAKIDELPLLNADVDVQYEHGSPRLETRDSDDEEERRRKRWEREDELQEEYSRALPDDEGCYHDDPLWYGKTMEQIKYATELEKSNGNAASREEDWKRANRYWKNALKGALKLKDAETEIRLRLNLALGYTRRQKTDKAIEHCEAIFRERLKSVATPALLAKAHYRSGEAFLEAGEESKALRSFRSVLEREPRNVEARRKVSELKSRHQARREREAALFRDALRTPATAEASAPADEAAPDLEAGPEAGAGGHESDVEESCRSCTDGEDFFDAASCDLTDRSASARLFRGLSDIRGGGLNFRVGETMTLPMRR
eukprot:TRINITY_DN64477_c0_g1_i1.p1 TRINITY_DN64477_c0_g1~~TRINITY_DN64477_c0_g1_i1.p1  ORF type:complete len:323 (+),score=87.70 TRINITY_DN64477_c0_g1_i1:61-1029(+)